MEYNRDVNGGTIDNPQQRRNWVPAFHKLDGMVNADSIGGVVMAVAYQQFCEIRIV